MMYDVCIVGSGAGAGPVAYELSKAGFKVLILEGLRDYLYLLDNSHKDLIPLFIENKKQEEQDSNEENNLDEEW